MEYQILMGLELDQQWQKAVADLIERQKNPILDQPKQKWHRGAGIYRVLQPFSVFKPGDNILMQDYVHTRIVKLATPIEKTEFIPWTRELNAGTLFTPFEWETLFRPLNKDELWHLLPHLRYSIKDHGEHLYMQFYPEFLCKECFPKFNLELKDPKFKVAYKSRCKSCGTEKRLTARRSYLKPIAPCKKKPK